MLFFLHKGNEVCRYMHQSENYTLLIQMKGGGKKVCNSFYNLFDYGLKTWKPITSESRTNQNNTNQIIAQ